MPAMFGRPSIGTSLFNPAAKDAASEALSSDGRSSAEVPSSFVPSASALRSCRALQRPLTPSN